MPNDDDDLTDIDPQSDRQDEDYDATGWAILDSLAGRPWLGGSADDPGERDDDVPEPGVRADRGRPLPARRPPRAWAGGRRPAAAGPRAAQPALRPRQPGGRRERAALPERPAEWDDLTDPTQEDPDAK